MISPSATHYVENHSHAAVLTAARGCLKRASYKSVRRVSCEYDDQVLYLRGRLPSYFQKQLAQEAVLGLAGVRQVVNEIEVAPWSNSTVY